MFPLFHRWPRLMILALAAIVVMATSAKAQTSRPNRKVHVVVFGVTDDMNVGKSADFNVRQMKTLFETGTAEGHLGALVTLKGKDANGRVLLDTIDRLIIRPDEALFVYMHAHGGFDAGKAFKDPAHGHFFALPGGDLLRKDLWQHMRGRKAALTVLVTESCFVPSYFTGPHPGGHGKYRATKDNPVLASLFLNHRGYVDVNACSKGESSWNYAPGSGGSYFTDSFVDMFYEQPFANPAKVGWPQFLKATSAKASGIYRSVRNNILKEPDRYNADLVARFRDQPDQRLAILQIGLTDTPPPPVATTRMIEVGQTIRDRLTDSDKADVIRTECVRKVYEVRLQAGRTYVIDMESSQVDPYLRLESGLASSIGDNLAEDDDGGGNLNARITYRPSASGPYFIIATTYRPAFGEFQLGVREEGGTGVLRVGAEGLKIPLQLTRHDPMDRVRVASHAKVVPIHLEAGRTYVIELGSLQVDSFLRVENASGVELAWDDDSLGDLNSRLEFRPTTTGTYRVIATTFRAEQTGDMLLRVRER